MAKRRNAAPEIAKQQVIISLNDSGFSKFAATVTSLKKRGLVVTEEFANTGTVTGEVEESNLSALKKVPGVEAVEVSQTYQLPPPSSNIM